MISCWVCQSIPLHPADAVGEEAQGAAGGDARVELAQGPGGGVAGVGEDLAALLLLAGVQGVEILLGDDHLAADLEQRGQRVRLAHEAQGHVLHRAQVLGHLLAHFAVAAGGGGDQPAALIDDLHGQAVELGVDPELAQGLGQAFPDRVRQLVQGGQVRAQGEQRQVAAARAEKPVESIDEPFLSLWLLSFLQEGPDHVLHRPAQLVALLVAALAGVGLGQAAGELVEEETRDAPAEFAPLLLGKGVVQAVHGQGVADLAEARGRGGAHAVGRRGRVVELGVRSLDGGKLAQQRVVFGVGDFRGVEDVVAVVVVLDGPAQGFGPPGEDRRGA